MALKGLKGLSEKEAEAFFELCRKQPFSAKDVSDILVRIQAPKDSKSTAYNLVQEFEEKGLITPTGNHGKKQQYECIHPRAIYNWMKTDLKNVEKELTSIEEAYETSMEENNDPREMSKVLPKESSISSLCFTLSKYCDIIIIHDNSKIMSNFLDSIKECGRTKLGSTNVILFKNEEKNLYGYIDILKRNERHSIRLYGHVVYDYEKYDYYIKKEVNGNE